jgi:hypothetical protein
MAKVISYELTSEGMAPSFIIDGGYYPTSQLGQERILIGIAEDATYTNDVTVYETKEELIAYLDTYASEMFNVVNLYTQETTPFSSAESAEFIWAKLN